MRGGGYGNKRAITIKGKGYIQVEGCKGVDKNSVECIVEAPVRWGTNSYVEIGYMGGFSYFCNNTYMKNVSYIGRFTSISSDVSMGLPNHATSLISSSSFLLGKAENNWYMPFIREDIEKNKDWIESNIQYYRMKEKRVEEISIGNDVWIGKNVVIKEGVKIGDGAVIGTGAIVTKDVEPYSVVAGVPAKILRKRFSERVIEQLLEIKWWDYGPQIIMGLDPNVDMAVSELAKRVKGANQYEGVNIIFNCEKKEIFMNDGGQIKLLYKR